MTKRSLTKDEIQDEHTCLSCIFESLRNITKDDGFSLKVLGKNVHLKVWIHYFIGDTEGHNKWLGQYPGNREGVKRPYRDCKCTYNSLSDTNLTCDYITYKDIGESKKGKSKMMIVERNILSPSHSMILKMPSLRSICLFRIIFTDHTR